MESTRRSFLANANGRAAAMQWPMRRVLVIDDNVDAANSLATLLRLQGREVRAVYDGPTALLVYARFKPDLVIVDLVMPKMDGLMTAAALRDMSGVPARIIGITGVGGDALRTLSAADELDGYLTKPVSLQAIQQLLRGY